MKILSWVLVCWPLLFAIFVIAATEMADAPIDHTATAIHEVVPVSNFSAGADSTDIATNLRNAHAVLP